MNHTEGRLLLQARVWAAEVRDRQGDHATASTHAVELAGTLCHLLDIRDRLQADNLRQSVEASILLIVSEMIAHGVKGPSREE